MVDPVRRNPEDGAALERERGAPGQKVLDRFRCLVGTVRQQPVIPHADPQHAGDDVQHQSGENRAEIPEGKGGQRTEVKDDQRDGRNPVDAALMLAAVGERG